MEHKFKNTIGSRSNLELCENNYINLYVLTGAYNV